MERHLVRVGDGECERQIGRAMSDTPNRLAAVLVVERDRTVEIADGRHGEHSRFSGVAGVRRDMEAVFGVFRAGDVERPPDGLETTAGTVEQALAGRRENDTLVRPHEQWTTDGPFEAGDALADRRLRQVKLAGRSGE